MRAKHYEGHIQGWALKIESFWGPEMARKAICKVHKGPLRSIKIIMKISSTFVYFLTPKRAFLEHSDKKKDR